MRCAMICMLVMLWTSASFAQITTHEIAPSDDTYVSDSHDDRNYGSDSTYEIHPDNSSARTLMKFSSTDIQNILVGKELISARLELPIYRNKVKTSETISLHRLKVDWDEHSATWNCARDTNLSNNKKDCDESWRLKKIFWFNSNLDYEESSFAGANVARQQEVPIGINLESYVQDLNNGAENFGFVIIRTRNSYTSDLKLLSKEIATGPRLILKVKEIAPVSQNILAKLATNIQEGNSPLEIHFDASESSVVAGISIDTLTLELGNGESVVLDKQNPKASFTYTEEGEYQALLQVKASSGEVSSIGVNISVFGDEVNQKDKNYGYHITPDQDMKVDYKAGEKALISGDICKIWKTHFWKDSSRCHHIDSTKLSVQMFFPDMTSPITSLANIQKIGNKRMFSFETPELQEGDLNTLTIMVGEFDQKVVRLGGMKSKIKKRILVLDRFLSHIRGGKHQHLLGLLEEVKYGLERVCDKIDDRNANQPNILAQYNIPLQVENKVSNERYYSTLIDGLRIELTSEIGNIFEGDYAHFKSRITNLSYSHRYYKADNYIFAYSYKGQPLQKITELNFEKGKEHEFYFKDSERSILSDLHEFAVEIEEVHRWGKHRISSAQILQPVMPDNTAPKWDEASIITEKQYFQDYPVLLMKVSDPLGGMDQSSVFATINGEVVPDLTIVHSEENASELILTKNLNPLPEGDYVLEVVAKDFAGNFADPNPNSRNFVIDRTKPVITVALETPLVTNNPILSIPIDIIDDSPVEGKIFQNSQLREAFSDSNNIVNINLSEGQNVLEVQVQDLAGNIADSIIRDLITLDTIAPVIISSSPSGFLTNNSLFRFEAQVTEALSTSTVIKNNGLVVLETDEQSISFDITLNMGNNKIEAISTDQAGNISVTLVLDGIVLDNTAPVVAFTTPASPTATANLILPLTITDASEVTTTWTLNGSAQTVLQGNNPQIEANLSPGENVITFKSTDAANNETETHTINILYDHLPPIVSLNKQGNIFTNEVAFDLQVIIEDISETQTKVFLNGTEVFSSSEKSFSYTANLIEGVNALTVQSSDSAGLHATPVALENISLDTVAPGIYLDITDNIVVRESPFEILGTIEDSNPTSLIIEVNGSQVVNDSDVQSQEEFTYQLPLQSGNNIITFKAQDNHGNSATYSLGSIFYDTISPIANFSINTDGQLPDMQVLLDASSSSAGVGNIIKYQWRLNGPTLYEFEQSNFSFPVISQGFYPIHLTVFDEGGLSSYKFLEVYIDENGEISETYNEESTTDLLEEEFLKPFARALVSDSAIYKGDTVIFDASPSFSYTGQIVSIHYDFGDGESYSSNEFTVPHTYVNPGEFTPVVTITDDTGRSNSFTLLPVEVLDLEAVATRITVSEVEGNAPLTVIVDASASTPSQDIVSYEYNMGDGTFITSEESSIEYTYQSEGEFELSVEAVVEHELGESSVATTSIIVLERDDPPVAELSYSNITGRVPMTVVFDASDSFDDKGIISYQWQVGENGPIFSGGDLRSFSHIFTDSGVQEVKLTLTDTKGQVTDTVLTLPIGLGAEHPGEFVIYNGEGGYPRTVVFDATVEGNELIYDYIWSINGEEVRTKSAVLYKDFDGSGSYDISLSIGDPVSKKVKIGQSKNFVLENLQEENSLLFSTGSTIADTIVNFEVANSSSNEFKVNFGDGFIENFDGNTFSHGYHSAGVYQVSIDDGSVVETRFVAIAPNMAPEVRFASSSLSTKPPYQIEVSNILILDEEEDVTSSFNWGDGQIQNYLGEEALSYEYLSSGQYQISFKAKDRHGREGVFTETYKARRVNTAPIANLVVDQSSGNPHLKVNFDASQSSDDLKIISYRYDIPGYASQTVYSPDFSFTFKEAGTYPVKLTVKDENGASDSVTQIIRANAYPNANFTYNVSGLTKPFEINLNASSSTDDVDGLTYEWYLGENLLEVTQVPETSHTVNLDGLRFIKLKVIDSDGRADEKLQMVQLNQPPKANGFVSPMFGDYPLNIQLNGSLSFDDKAITSANWFLNDELISGDLNSNLIIEEAGFYQLKLVVQDETGLSDEINFPVTVFSNPDPTAAFNYTLTEQKAPTNVMLDASNSSDDKKIVSYSWNIEGSIYQSDSPKLKKFFNLPGNFNVTLTVTDSQGEESSLAQTITILENEAPQAELLASVNQGELPLRVDFDATGSSDDEGVISYEINFGEGAEAVTGPKPSHVFTQSGTFDVVATVKDRQGLTSSSVQTIVVQNSQVADDQGPTIYATPMNEQMSVNQEEILVVLNDSSQINYQTLKVLWDETVLTNIQLNEQDNFFKIILDENAPKAIDETRVLTIGITDEHGNHASRAFVYQIVENAGDLAGPIFNFSPAGGELAERELSVEVFLSDRSGVNYSTLKVYLGGVELNSEQIQVNAQKNKISLSFMGAFALPEENFNLVEVHVQDSLGNLGIGKLGLDTQLNEVVLIDDNSSNLSPRLGLTFSCFKLESADIKCFGENHFGQLGIGNFTSVGFGNGYTMQDGPLAQVGEKAISVSSGDSHACVLLKSGNIRCFGANSFGQLGLGHTNNIGDNEFPADVPFLDFGGKAEVVASSSDNTCVIYDGGKLKCFGRNRFGELGVGHSMNLGDDETLESIPDVDIGGVVKQIAIGESSFACALMESGNVRCFGRYEYIGYGGNENIGDDEVPASASDVNLGGNAIKVASGSHHTCALLDSGGVRCFGSNSSGRLGTPGSFNGKEPYEIPLVDLGEPAVDITVGRGHTCALLESNKVRCWGANSQGELGIGNTENIGDNETVLSVPAIEFPEKVITLVAGFSHTCAILENKKARCWGSNNRGQLGLGHTETIGDNESILEAGYAILPDLDIGLGVGSSEDATVNIIPRLSVNTFFGTSPLTVQLDARSSTSINGEIVSYLWSFGDGQTLLEPTGLVEHTYQQINAYRVTVTIVDETSQSATTETAITVSDKEVLPVAIFTTNKNFGTPGEEFTFNGSTSYDAKGEISSFIWEFGDGSTQTTTNAVVNHGYNDVGTYIVNLQVIGESGRVSEKHELAIVVKETNEIPVASINCSIEGYQVICNAGMAVDYDGTVELIRWDMGDGNQVFGENTIYTYQTGGQGQYNIQLDVVDNKGFVFTQVTTVFLDHAAPSIASNLTSNIFLIDRKLNIDLSIVDESLTFTEIFVNGSLQISSDSKLIQDYLWLEQDNNIISIIGRDLAGNLVEHIYDNIIVQNLPPKITTNLVGKLLINESHVDLIIDIDDEGETQTGIIVNNQIWESTIKEKNIARTLPLSEGKNSIQILSTDAQGHFSFELIDEIIVDTKAPELLTLSPDSGSNILGKSAFIISGTANEVLSEVSLNGVLLTLSSDKKSFEYNYQVLVEGEASLSLKIKDLAGNILNYPVEYDILRYLMYSELIEVQPEGENLKLIGHPGATRYPGQEIAISSGLFSQEFVSSKSDGSFEKIIHFTDEVELNARSNEWDYEQKLNLAYNVDTTLSGAIKDIDGTPLPGVRVTIQSTGQSALTDASGIFSISAPALGDQIITIDGTTIDEAVTGGAKLYSKTARAVSLGYKQTNALEYIIYLAPLLLDGSEMIVDTESDITISSSKIPDFSLHIAAGTAEFPGGTEVEIDGEMKNVINIVEVPADRTSIAPLPGIDPGFVFALEPTGVKFSQAADITLPNVNEFSEGAPLLLLSKNDLTGTWDINGAATVENGVVKSSINSGILHFSEFMVIPYGLEISSYGEDAELGINLSKGSYSTQVELPSFKVNGKDITPNLIYNSSWAKPQALVSNAFKFDRSYKIKRRSKTSKDFFHGGTVEVTVEAWTDPDELKSEFFIGNTQSQVATFDLIDVPEKAVISYAVDLSHLNSGVHTARASYEIKYKHLTIVTTKSSGNLLGGLITVDPDDPDPDRTINYQSIFPEDIRSNLNIQNRVNSPYGRGWKLGLTKEILNPESTRILLEDEGGGLTTFLPNDTIETLIYDSNGINAGSVNGSNQLIYFTSNGDLKEARFISGEYDILPLGKLKKHQGAQAINFAYHISKTTKWRNYSTSPVVIKEGKYYEHKYKCDLAHYDFNLIKNVENIVEYNGSIYYLDNQGAIYSYSNGNDILVSGVEAAPPTYSVSKASSLPDRNPTCQENLKVSCTNDMKLSDYYKKTKTHKTSGSGSSDKNWKPELWRCGENRIKLSKGKIPVKSYSSGSLLSSQYKNPSDMAFSKTESGVIYVADYGNHVIRKIDLNTNTSSIFAGNRSTNDSLKHADALNAKLIAIKHPLAVTTDSEGNVYFTSENGLVRKVDINGRVYKVAGWNRNLQAGPESDNTVDRLFLSNAKGLVYDDLNGFLYIADTNNHRIVRLDNSKKITTQVVGNGLQCSGSPACIQNGSLATQISINFPKKIGLDENSNLILVDSANKLMRRVNFSFNESQQGLLSFKSPSNQNVSLYRLADGSFELNTRGNHKVYFDSEGRVKEEVDRLGNKFKFVHENGKLIELKAFDGKVTYLSYANGLLESIRDPANRVTTFGYNGNQLITVGFENGTAKSFGYNTNGLLRLLRNERSFDTLIEYNSQDRLSQIIRPDGSSESSSRGQDLTAVEGGHKNVENEELKNFYEDANNITYEMTEDFNGFISTIKDGKDRITTIERDSKNRVRSIARYDNSYTTFIYDEQTGDLLEKYDSRSNLLEKYNYNSFGDLLIYENSNGQKEINTYYPSGTFKGLLETKVAYKGEVNPGIAPTRFTYFSNGLVESVTKGDETQTYQYNLEGNLIKKIAPGGEEVNYTRDLAGNVIEKVDGKGTKIYYTFDSFNRLTSVATGVNLNDPVGQVTSYEYLPTGVLSKIIDPKQNETVFEYNSLDRISKKISPLGQVTELAYDGNGNVLWQRDPMSNVTTFEYDSDNLLRKKVLNDNVYEMNYDLDGNLVSASDNDSEIIFTYENVRGEFQISTARSIYDNSLNQLISYEYNDQGQRELMTTSLGEFSYSYDSGNRLQKLKNHLGEFFQFEYDSNNRLSKISRPGSVSDFNFNDNSFLTSISHTKGNEILNYFHYERDVLGNRTKLTTTYGESILGYDRTYQLTYAKNGEIDGPYKEENFTYDSLGNRIADQLSEIAYTYDEKSQRLTEDYKYFYFYDHNGNLSSRQEKGMTGNFDNYIYSTENQLIRIEHFENSQLVTQSNYFYDALGRRFKKEVEDLITSSKSYTRQYLYDGQEILAEFNQDSLLAVYTHSTLRTDDVLAVDVKNAEAGDMLAISSGSYFYLKDELGSIIDIVDFSGSLVQHYTYSSFGKVLKISDGNGNDVTDASPVRTSYGFTNREHDSESGMMFFRARYYQPELGRFIQEDSDPGNLGVPSTLNSRYIYAVNNPIYYIDPTGDFIFTSGFLLASLILAGTFTAIDVFDNLSKGQDFFKALGNALSLSNVIGNVAAGFGAVFVGTILTGSTPMALIGSYFAFELSVGTLVGMAAGAGIARTAAKAWSGHQFTGDDVLNFGKDFIQDTLVLGVFYYLFRGESISPDPKCFFTTGEPSSQCPNGKGVM